MCCMEPIVVDIVKGEYANRDAVYNVIQYACRLNNPNLIGGYGITMTCVEDVINQFYIVKRMFGVNGGKQVMHFVFSIEKTLYFKPEQVKELGYMIGRYFSNERQVLFAVHDDTEHLHIHMVVNTVSFLNGSYQAFWDYEPLHTYAKFCINKMIDKIWFGKHSA